MQKAKPDVAAVVAQLPQPDSPDGASKFTGPDPEAAEQLAREILAGGRASIVELIEMIRHPSDPDFKEYRPDYMLHCLAVYVGRPGNEDQRQMFAQTLASVVDAGKCSVGARKILIRQLQVAGGNEVVGTLGKQLLNGELCEPAAQALIAIGQGAPKQLRSALPKVTGKNRVTIIQALGVVRDSESVAALNQAVEDESPDVRRAAAWALANIGSASAAGPIIKQADKAQGWERIQTTKACLLLAERLAAAGDKNGATKIYAHLCDTRKESDELYVRQAAQKGMAGL